MTFASDDDGLWQTETWDRCRSCDEPTNWTDYISWICPLCYDLEQGE